MTLIGAKRWRIEVNPCHKGCHFVVSVEPVAFIGRLEFKTCAAYFKRLFMNLVSKWRWERRFADKSEASSFAKALAKSLEELAYVVDGRLCLATPIEEA